MENDRGFRSAASSGKQQEYVVVTELQEREAEVRYLHI